MKILIAAGLLTFIVYACTETGVKSSDLFNPSKLNSEVFRVDITKDTVLKTRNGALIKIPHGALSAEGAFEVQLEIKEAYSIQDMILGNLITQSNGAPLSSGGMIYINAVGENHVRITQAVSVMLPASSLNKDMKLYKGAQMQDSTINWIDPVPLPSNPLITALENGKNVFQTNCVSCHNIGKDITGPDLAHIVKRSPRLDNQHNLLYEFTKYSQHYIASNEYYACLFKKWNKVIMPSFPDLSETELNNLYAYIENESEQKNLPIPDNGILSCLDSCKYYYEVKDKWQQLKDRLEKDSSEMVVENLNIPTATGAAQWPATFDTATNNIINNYITNRIDPQKNKSLYYQFTIESFGWYNIDLLLKDIYDQVNLSVRVQGKFKERFNIYLVVPDIKVYLPGGHLDKGNDTYGFFTKDGSIPLPQDAKAYILAMGEYKDQVIFGKLKFTVRKTQQLSISLTTVTKEKLSQEIEGLKLEDITIQIDDTKNAAELRKSIRELEKAEQLKPKNCDCDCFSISPVYGEGKVPDSTQAY